MIHFVLLLNRQCKVRLAKWYSQYPQKDRDRITREVGFAVTQRPPNSCNFIEWRDMTVVFKRYASLFFIACVDRGDNELMVLETIHRFVFILDKYFGSVTELDLIYDFSRAFLVLDELFVSGEQQESSAAEVLRIVDNQDELHKAELVELASKVPGTSQPAPK